MLLLKNGTVVTGDGKTVKKNASVLVKKDLILDVLEYVDPSIETYATQVFDCTGKAILPGMINHHQHGVTFGPMFASGAKSPGRERIIELLDRNLLQGHTTVMNVDGFVTMDEVKETQKAHPIRIKTATTHIPVNLEAGLRCDGSGLEEKHRTMTAEKMLEEGAVCIGEIGGGHTLGGGGQDYLYIPRAVKNATGRDIDYLQARAMKLSVLGRYIEGSYYDRDRVAQALKEHNLDSFLTPEQTRDIVFDTTLASVKLALDGYIEAAQEAKKFNVPLLAHNAPTSMKVFHEIAKLGLERLIAAHSNYLFTLEEAVENTKKLRNYPGVIIDAAVHDPFGAKRLVSVPDNLFAFFQQGLVDIISTDFAAGTFDSMLEAMQHGVERNLISLPKAVALGTKNVADALPGIAPNLGLLQKGFTADIVVTAYPEISRVVYIFIGGQLVAREGKRLV
ncbi:MAG: amidohydrolase family protein [Bacillota bacterium]